MTRRTDVVDRTFTLLPEMYCRIAEIEAPFVRRADNAVDLLAMKAEMAPDAFRKYVEAARDLREMN